MLEVSVLFYGLLHPPVEISPVLSDNLVELCPFGVRDEARFERNRGLPADGKDSKSVEHHDEGREGGRNHFGQPVSDTMDRAHDRQLVVFSVYEQGIFKAVCTDDEPARLLIAVSGRGEILSRICMYPIAQLEVVEICYGQRKSPES